MGFVPSPYTVGDVVARPPDRPIRIDHPRVALSAVGAGLGGDEPASELTSSARDQATTVVTLGKQPERKA
jgi:hypothetical protein